MVQTAPLLETVMSPLSPSLTPPAEMVSILSRTAFLVGTSRDPFQFVASYASSGTTRSLEEVRRPALWVRVTLPLFQLITPPSARKRSDQRTELLPRAMMSSAYGPNEALLI